MSELKNVQAAAEVRGMTAEKENDKYIKGLWFYVIKRNGAVVGKMFPSEKGWDGYFPTRDVNGDHIGTIGMEDAMEGIERAAIEWQAPAKAVAKEAMPSVRAFIETIDGIAFKVLMGMMKDMEPQHYEAGYMAIVGYVNRHCADWTARALAENAAELEQARTVQEPLLFARLPQETAWEEVTQIEFDHASVNGFEVYRLYTHPQPSADDARDAARYRWLRHGDLDALAEANWGNGSEVFTGKQFDSAVDAAMKGAK